jgi:PAS domain S-box-containing protein
VRRLHIGTLGKIDESTGRSEAEERLRESDARKSAILNAAFDCIITMDAEGRIVEVNRATERTFGYTAEEMVGRELAELIIPPHLRDAHRRGVERYVRHGEARLLGHPTELPAMRADGTEFPVEIAIARPAIPGPPQFTGYLRDVTKRHRDELALRTLADEQAALRRVATAVASEVPQQRLFDVVTEEVGRLLGAHTANMLRFEPEGTGLVLAGWSVGGAPAVPVGMRVEFDGPTPTARILETGLPQRADDLTGVPGETAEMLRGLGFRSIVGTPIKLSGRLWGAVMVSTVHRTPFPEGAEQRISDFAELVALALANAEAREELAASRARIVEAGDAERRRIERNLHDGAQQRLVALSLMLRLARTKLAKGDEDALGVLDRANAELADAVQELRELARGIHPAVLTDRGLVAALEMLVGRANVPVELCAEFDGRLPQPVEAAAYYLVSEALTNASKHAGACSVRVEVRRENGAALVEVADDGRGGAESGSGSGLRGLADRIEALGGRLEVKSAVGEGTALRAHIPCPDAAR